MVTSNRFYLGVVALAAGLATACGSAPTSPTPFAGSATAGATASTVTATGPQFTFTMSESGPVAAGTTLAFGYGVTNNSAVTQDQVLVIGGFPDGMVISGFGPNDNCARTNARGISRFTCNVGNLAPGATGTATTFVTPSNPGNFSITAQSSGPLLATVTTVVTPGATDLQISASVPSGTVGTPLPMQYQIKNSGTRVGVGATLDDSLPAGLTPTSATTSVGTCLLAGNWVHCDLGDMAPSAQALVTITAVPGAAGNFPNTATTSMTSPDSQPGNNSVSHVVKVR
jgi:hypothetical protein